MDGHLALSGPHHAGERHTVSDPVLRAIETSVRGDGRVLATPEARALLNDPASELQLLRTLVLSGISITEQAKVCTTHIQRHLGETHLRPVTPGSPHPTPPRPAPHPALLTNARATMHVRRASDLGWSASMSASGRLRATSVLGGVLASTIDRDGFVVSLSSNSTGVSGLACRSWSGRGAHLQRTKTSLMNGARFSSPRKARETQGARTSSWCPSWWPSPHPHPSVPSASYLRRSPRWVRLEHGARWHAGLLEDKRFDCGGRWHGTHPADIMSDEDADDMCEVSVRRPRGSRMRPSPLSYTKKRDPVER